MHKSKAIELTGRQLDLLRLLSAGNEDDIFLG